MAKEPQKAISRTVWNRTSRRDFVRLTGMGTYALCLSNVLGSEGIADKRFRHQTGELKRRIDLLDNKSAKDIEVFQLTSDTTVPASHLYMEAQVFTPDSKRFLLHR